MWELLFLFFLGGSSLPFSFYTIIQCTYCRLNKFTLGWDLARFHLLNLRTSCPFFAGLRAESLLLFLTISTLETFRCSRREEEEALAKESTLTWAREKGGGVTRGKWWIGHIYISSGKHSFRGTQKQLFSSLFPIFLHFWGTVPVIMVLSHVRLLANSHI